MTYLDFRHEADEQTTSWQRADPRAALVERVDPITFRVMLQGGSEYHRVHYALERGAHVGWCDCKGFEYRDDENSPCAHLCTLRKAEGPGEITPLETVNGEPIEAVDSSALEGGTEIEPDKRAMTDGGLIDPPAAGSDGRTFGRPESRL
ncbi:hypothetical protein [Natrinema versiforme]|uniref:SWIM-type domain-containing protein n=1 Tax=Natrinema versiforme JCM 10478 TaxID=1227496 RepID=L9Y5H8_9EURY|nr:hypothetical protein [Natrinema versiforme]ELY69319.1 hypothetical protein C489_05178 [Natrinema versiforme JCM 10478]